jgi:hypothetical protein
MLDWSYSAGDDLSRMDKIKAAGLEHWTCPGVSTWCRIFPNVENACGNIAERAVKGEETGATGLLNTDWGDGGHTQMPSASYHGYAWGAEQSWTPSLKTNRADFDRRFAWAWFGDSSGDFGRFYTVMAKTTRSRSIYRSPVFRPWALYWDRFPCDEWLDVATPSAIRTLHSQARKGLEIITRLSDRCPEHDDVLREMLFGIAQLLFVRDKVNLSRRVRELRAEGEERLPGDVRREARRLLDEWNGQRREFKDLWLAKNRASQIDYRLKQYSNRARDYRRLLK